MDIWCPGTGDRSTGKGKQFCANIKIYGDTSNVDIYGLLPKGEVFVLPSIKNPGRLWGVRDPQSSEIEIRRLGFRYTGPEEKIEIWVGHPNDHPPR